MWTAQEAEFVELHSDYYRRVYRFIAYRTNDLARAEELAGDVFRLAWQKSELHPGIGWLLATARNVVGNEYKARERSQMLQERLQQEAMAAESEHNTNERALVAQVLEQLSEKEREVLMLSYWDDLTTIELAEALGCSPTAAGVRLHRARKSFAKHIPAQLAQERTA